MKGVNPPPGMGDGGRRYTRLCLDTLALCAICPARGHNERMRVVVTRIEPDGTMQRRVVDTGQRDDAPGGKTWLPALWRPRHRTALSRAPPSTTSA